MYGTSTPAKANRTVLVVVLDGLADARTPRSPWRCTPLAAHPDTAMSVRLTTPVDASVVAAQPAPAFRGAFRDRHPARQHRAPAAGAHRGTRSGRSSTCEVRGPARMPRWTSWSALLG